MTFHTTRWTVVRAASGAPAGERRAALETLCRAYWKPVHAFVQKRGASPVLAEDLTQAFFARLLEKQDLRQADPDRGRFRTFLLASLKHFLSNERDRERAEKRGGGRVLASLDAAESPDSHGPRGAATPEREFERDWARSVLERALERLGEEQRRAEKGAQWEALRAQLTADEERVPGAALAAQLGLSENAVRVAVHRLRRRFGELVRDEVRETVGPGEVDDEVRELRRALE